jgi:phytoene dehydrogenase-like protein
LTSSFSKFYSSFISSSPRPKLAERFLRNHFDYLSFALSGYGMSRTQTAPVAYMVGDLHLKGASVNFPSKGTALGGIVDTLVEGIRESGGKVENGRTVTSLVLDSSNKCVGVRTSDGGEIRGEGGVILNVGIWSVPSILEEVRERMHFI